MRRTWQHSSNPNFRFYDATLFRRDVQGLEAPSSTSRLLGLLCCIQSHRIVWVLRLKGGYLWPVYSLRIHSHVMICNYQNNKSTEESAYWETLTVTSYLKCFRLISELQGERKDQKELQTCQISHPAQVLTTDFLLFTFVECVSFMAVFKITEGKQCRNYNRDKHVEI